jgi:hypothetical protein
MSIVSHLTDYSKSNDMDLRLNMNGNRIKNIPLTSVESGDAVSKKYVDDLTGSTLQTTMKHNVEENAFSTLLNASVSSAGRHTLFTELYPQVLAQEHAFGSSNFNFTTLGIGSEYKIKQRFSIEFDGGVDKNHHIIGHIVLKLSDPVNFAVREEIQLSQLDSKPITIPRMDNPFTGEVRNMFEYEITIRRTTYNKMSAYLTTRVFSSSTQMEGQSLEVIDNLFTENEYTCIHDPVEFMMGMYRFDRYVEVGIVFPQEDDNDDFTIFHSGYTEATQMRKPFS